MESSVQLWSNVIGWEGRDSYYPVWFLGLTTVWKDSGKVAMRPGRGTDSLKDAAPPVTEQDTRPKCAHHSGQSIPHLVSFQSSPRLAKEAPGLGHPCCPCGQPYISRTPGTFGRLHMVKRRALEPESLDLSPSPTSAWP